MHVLSSKTISLNNLNKNGPHLFDTEINVLQTEIWTKYIIFISLQILIDEIILISTTVWYKLTTVRVILHKHI